MIVGAGAAQAQPTLACFGGRPQWKLTVDNDAVSFEAAPNLGFRAYKSDIQNGTRISVLHSEDGVDALNAGIESLEIYKVADSRGERVSDAKVYCSVGENPKQYRYSAQVYFKGVVYIGCCEDNGESGTGTFRIPRAYN
jgi:uncharacterized membrane protein